jgi:hypothetical protein
LGRKASKPPKPHKTRQEKLEAAAKSIGAAVDFLLQTGKEPFEGDAHALLVWVYKNPELPAAMRLQAAQAAAPMSVRG